MGGLLRSTLLLPNYKIRARYGSLFAGFPTPEQGRIFPISFSDGLAIAALALTILLLVLDKAEKVKGPVLLILLSIAFALFVPLAVGNRWVMAEDIAAITRFFRAATLCCVVGVCYSALSLWVSTADEKPIPKTGTAGQFTGLSLKKLAREDSVMFMKHPLEADQTLYRFRINNGGQDIADMVVALDLPAPLAKEPFVIDQSGIDDLTVKAAFAGYTRTPPRRRTERVSGFSNSAVIEMSRFRRLGSLDVGLITAPLKPKQIIMVTAPDGSIQLTVAPAYDRYGSVSVRHSRSGAKDGAEQVTSFPIGKPVADVELIDRSKPLRPWSRSVLSLVTQEEMLEAMKAGTKINIEQHFN